MSDLLLLVTFLRDVALVMLVGFTVAGLLAFGMLASTYRRNGWKPYPQPPPEETRK